VSPPAPPIEPFLARNFVAAILTPAFLVDPDGVLTFYNEAAGELIGHHFEEHGRLTREEWNEIGPLDEQGRPIPSEGMPLTVAMREGRPACERIRIRTDQGALLEVETTALPLIGDDAFYGALVVFVPVDGRTGQAANEAR
jgi:PAS domain-containing protein